MELQLEDYDRVSFPVKGVEVTFENYQAVAEWCKGRVGSEPTRLLGTTADLPVIFIKGYGDNKAKEQKATIGCFVVSFNGTFRVYRPNIFSGAFVKREKKVEDLEVTPETKAEWSEEDCIVCQTTEGDQHPHDVQV